MILVIFFVAGMLAQIVDGVAGMGFGVVSATILVGFGLAPAIASASIHTAEIATTLASGISHFKFGNVKKDWLLSLIVPGVFGGAAGAYLLASIPGGTMKPYVAGLLLVMGVIILYRFLSKREREPRKVPKKLIGFMGLVAAFFDAIGGGGWGPIATPGLLLSSNEEPRKVIGTVNLAEFIITISIAVTFFVKLGVEKYDWATIGVFALAGCLMAPLAAWLTKKISPRKLGILAGSVVILYNLRTLLKIMGVPLP